METFTSEEVFDSLSPYEIAILAFSSARVSDNRETDESTIIITSKDSLLWAGAIAHAMIFNPGWGKEEILSAFNSTLDRISYRERDLVVGDTLNRNFYHDNGINFIREFLAKAGVGDDLNTVIKRTEDAMHTLELRGIIVDPLFKKVRNLLIGIVTLFPVHFVIDGPNHVDIKTLSWEYTQKVEGDHTKREFRFRVKEATEAVVDDFIPAIINIAKKFGSNEPEITISEAQEKLTNLGYYTGEIDGKAGPKTINALRKFQQERYLFVTGHLDAKTIKALRNQE